MRQPLIAHPAAAPGVRLEVSASATRTRAGVLSLHYRVTGQVDAIRVPAPVASPDVRHLLWQHTCFELFLASGSGPRYWELNLSPSGEWAAYAFASYRQGAPLAPAPASPGIRWQADATALELRAELALPGLASELAGSPLRAGLSAVLEERDGRRSCWALHHVRPEPDFHDAGSFRLRIGPLGRGEEG